MSSDRQKLGSREIIGHVRMRITRILEYTKHDTVESYHANPLLQDAVERNFIAIGEAIKDLSRVMDLMVVYPSGPWSEPARFRDFLAHRYEEGISHPSVWRTITEDLPVLDDALARVEKLID